MNLTFQYNSFLCPLSVWDFTGCSRTQLGNDAYKAENTMAENIAENNKDFERVPFFQGHWTGGFL